MKRVCFLKNNNGHEYLDVQVPSNYLRTNYSRIKNTKFVIILLSAIALFSSCESSILERISSGKKDVFDFFWKSIDTKYSYFEFKHIDWDSAYTRFVYSISNEMSDDAFFDTLSVMVDLLQDGHSGIDSPFNSHKYLGFYTRGPENFDERLIIENYSHGWGSSTGPFKHISLCDGQVAYVYYDDFSNDIADDDIDYLLEKYKDSKGMIIDIRNNFGGSVDNIFMLVKRFIHQDTHLFDSKLKNGPGHNDFTRLTQTILSPADNTYSGKVCVLTNRKVYSAASVFTLAMQEVPNATIIGDTTGGGLGLPIGIELPNEWQIHCAGSQILSVSGVNMEWGVPPDIQVNMKEEDKRKGIDSIIETAIKVILDDQ